MVTAKDGADIDAVKEAILSAGEYDAQTFAEMRSSVMQVVDIVQYGLMGFGALAIARAIVNEPSIILPTNQPALLIV